MKKILLIILLIFTLTFNYADREITGSITSVSVFTPGQYLEMELRLNFSSLDEEIITYIELSFPEGVSMHNSPDPITDGVNTLDYSSHNGGIITWGAGQGDTSWGYLSVPEEPIHFTASLSINSSVIGEFVTGYQVLGSNEGGEPHGFAGEIVLTQNQTEDLKCYNLQGDSTPNWHMVENYRVKVRNYGPVPVEDYTVELLLDGESLCVEQGVEIASGQWEDIDFYWTPPEIGEFTLQAVVNYAADEHLENNQSDIFNIEVTYWGGIIGDGYDITYSIPANYYWRSSLTEQIYYAEEMWVNGWISSIEYFYNFTEVPETSDLNIWLGETALTDLSGGFIPSSELTLVHSGSIDYEEGEGVAYISLSQPYLYWGGNLVVLVQRPMDTQYYASGNKFYYSTDELNANRTVEKHSDVTDFEPDIAYLDGNLLGDYSHVRFHFIPELSDILQGVVTENGIPVSDVLVEIEGTQACTLSDENGIYTISQAYPGTYNLKASKPGYLDTVIENVEVGTDEPTFVDISIESIPFVTVSGIFLGSDNLEVGLDEVTVTFSGIIDYETTTQADGSFSFLDIPANGSYNLTASKQGYDDYFAIVAVNDTDLIMDDITLWEITYSATNLRAGYNENMTDIYLLWDAPPYIDRDFEFYRIYRLLGEDHTNPENWVWLADNYTETSYTDSTFGDVEPGIYEFAVAAVYSNNNEGYPDFISYNYFEPIFSPTELEVEAVENSLSLIWEAPDFGEREDRTINKPDNYIETETRDLFAYNIYLDEVIFESEIIESNFIFEDIDTTVLHQLGVSALYESGFESEIEIITYTPVDAEDELIPELKNWLGKNYPNPFNPSGAGRCPTTEIRFSLNTEITENTEILIYNVKGQKIKTLNVTLSGVEVYNQGASSPSTTLRMTQAGTRTHSVSWNGTDQSGNPVSSGLYLYKLKVGNKTIDTKKMMLLK